MKFRQFVPTMSANVRQNIANANGTPRQADQSTAALAVAEEIHASNRRPFYHVYPGVTAAMLRLGIERIDISHVHPPVNGLAMEFAEGHFIRSGDYEIAALMVADFGNVLFIEFIHADGNSGSFKFPREHQSLLDWLETIPESSRDLLTKIMQIVFGVCMIPQSDADLVKPLILNRDKDKYEATGDQKYIERARRNGKNGWEIGRDIPTPEEMEAMRAESGEPGRKSPHWRMGHFAFRYIGEGRSERVLRWIRETFVNKDLWKEVPHGYHGKETD